MCACTWVRSRVIPAGTFVRFCLSWTVVIVVLELAAMERWVEIPTHDPDQSSARARHFRLINSLSPAVLPSHGRSDQARWSGARRRAKSPRTRIKNQSTHGAPNTHWRQRSFIQPSPGIVQTRGGRLVSSRLIELAPSPAVGPQANPGYTPSIGIISIKCEENDRNVRYKSEKERGNKVFS